MTPLSPTRTEPGDVDDPAGARPDAPAAPVHTLDAASVATRYEVDTRTGLTTDEVVRRRERFGPNALPKPAPRPRLLLFLDQFRSLLVMVLIGAGVLAAVIGDVKDVVVIAVVVIANAILGFVQENRAESSLAALERMLETRARVRRDGALSVVPANELVPGDVVLVEAGDRVPADGRWVLAVDLEVDESAFTGESLPVSKQTDAVDAADVPLTDRPSMGYMNTSVARGRGELVITATGAATEIGKVAGMLERAEPVETPLQREIDALGRRLTLVAGVAVTVVFALGFLRDTSVADKMLNAIALAVAAIPEGLPAVLTLTLAVGTHQLAKRRAIVKRLASVETLGATTVICTDKTGTLTLNRMTVRELRPTRSEADLLSAAVLCNDAARHETPIGDPTEIALVDAADAAGIDVTALRVRYPRVAEVPFDSDRKWMATFHEDAQGVRVAVKGAPDALEARCRDVGGAALEAENEALAARGLRVLAVATRRLPGGSLPAGVDELTALVDDLTFEGLVGIADPPRPEARDAIALSRRAGIDVKMITGDHARTATAIARELGIDGETVTGRELASMSDEELTARIDDIGVFARVAPEHKLRIVRALQRRGEVVAMTGDGVNDAPALKQADIGVAMGITGTEVSREAATMVLTDDNFATIVDAVRGGRTIYDNITKFVSFQLATNLGAILTIVTASLFMWPDAQTAFFTPLAILWVNLIMDGPPAMALGVDPPGPGTMDRAPRSRDARILDARRFTHLLWIGTVMAAGTLLVSRWAEATGGGPTSTARAATMAFTTFVLFQVFNVHNARFPDRSVFGRHSLTNGKLWLALAAVVVLQVAAAEWAPLQRLFTGEEVAANLSPTDWLMIVAVASTVVLFEEIRKRLFRRNGGFR
jgi:Ca2+-transporting ATPase